MAGIVSPPTSSPQFGYLMDCRSKAATSGMAWLRMVCRRIESVPKGPTKARPEDTPHVTPQGAALNAEGCEEGASEAASMGWVSSFLMCFMFWMAALFSRVVISRAKHVAATAWLLHRVVALNETQKWSPMNVSKTPPHLLATACTR
eukprot:GDKJ01065063.1.p2 GENE.GDKJ01065063.1~~GDKJ01065063.1.p2  ORF type:complete len:147 (+),score=0.50 GDKJ01065063.1:627-1067(+)